MSLITLEIGKLHDQHFEPKPQPEREQEQDDEALSLCDLPITKIVGSSNLDDENDTKGDDFDFNFYIGSSIESGNTLESSEMCSADEVFSGGQILPFRHSVSSEAGLSKTRNSGWRSVSRSESMDRTLGLGSRSSSTRSSSIRSQYSRTSSTSTATSTSTCSNHTTSSVKTVPSRKIKSRNNFHSHPSPKPQVWASGARGNPINYATQNPISKKSTMWDVLRLGLVRAPEIEQRHRVSSASGRTIPFIIPRNDSSRSINSGSSESNSNTRGKISDVLSELHKKKNNNGGIFKSCKCSVLAIEPIPTRDIGRKTNYFGTKMLEGSKDDNIGSTMSSNIYYHFSKEDEELEQEKKVRLQEQEEKLKKKQGKKVMSHYHYRTFEWLRDLSHANVLNS